MYVWWRQPTQGGKKVSAVGRWANEDQEIRSRGECGVYGARRVVEGLVDSVDALRLYVGRYVGMPSRYLVVVVVAVVVRVCRPVMVVVEWDDGCDGELAV